MAKVARVLFNTNYYELGVVKYAKGEHYPVTPETRTRMLAGDAEEVQVDMDPKEASAETKAAADALAEERKATVDAEAAVRRGGDAIVA